MNRDEYRESVAAWLRRNRLTLEISQREIADAIGTADTSVSKWERGDHDISAYHHAKLRAFFKLAWAAREQNDATIRPDASTRGSVCDETQAGSVVCR